MRSNARFLLKTMVVAIAAASPVTYGQTILEEIIVTAQKREQSLQDAPLAVTAFGAKDVEQRGIYNV